MLKIPLLVGWELGQTRNAVPHSQPLFKYLPGGDPKKEENYQLQIFRLNENSYKFIPVQDGFVVFTTKEGPVKSSMSYEGFKKILAENPYLIMLGKRTKSTTTEKYKVFAALMFPAVDDIKAVKIACLRYIKEIEVSGTKHSVRSPDSQRSKEYTWEGLAFSFAPIGAYRPNEDSMAFREKHAQYYATGTPVGTKATAARYFEQPRMDKSSAKLFIKLLLHTYKIDPAMVQVRFLKRVNKVMGFAQAHMEDNYEKESATGFVITLMELDPYTIMHEVSHIICYKYFSRAMEGGAHGPLFTGVYAHVLDAFSPHIVPRKAVDFMRAGGLRVTPFSPNAQPAIKTSVARSHRDFEASHAIVANPRQNRTIPVVFKLRQQCTRLGTQQ